MQQSFVSQNTEINLLDIDLTGKTQNELADIAQQALGESLNLARRSVESAWFAGKVLERAKRNTKHGQWGEWLEQHGIAQSTDDRVRRLFREYQITQLGLFDTMSAALRAIPKKKQIIQNAESSQVQAAPQQTGDGALKDGKTPPKARAEQPQTVMVQDTSTGEMVEVKIERQPTATEQIYANEGKLDTSGGIHKEREKVQEWQAKTHRLKYRKSKQGIEIPSDLAVGDEVTMTGAELFYLVKNFVLIGNPPKDSVAFHKGDVI